jgi:hypothetical protein
MGSGFQVGLAGEPLQFPGRRRCRHFVASLTNTNLAKRSVRPGHGCSPEAGKILLEWKLSTEKKILNGVNGVGGGGRTGECGGCPRTSFWGLQVVAPEGYWAPSKRTRPWPMTAVQWVVYSRGSPS